MGQDLKRVTVVAAYEDSPTDARVNDFCRDLGRHFGENCEVIRQRWLFNELRIPQLRAIAAREAALADIVVICAHHADSLPDEVRNWIETWAGQKAKRAIVLVALFDPPYRGDSGSMRAYLDGVARRGNLEFIVLSEEMPEGY